MRLSSLILAGFALPLILSGCRRAAEVKVGDGDDPTTLSLIMSDSGFNSEVVPILKQEMEAQGYRLKWVVVNDIIQPNKLVNDNQADANSFQHEPYFDQFVADHGLNNIVRGFYTQFTPSGLYSRRYKNLAELPEGAIVGIPVDPSNNGRALFMLQEHGLLKMKPGVSVTHASVRDIIDNPRKLTFREVDQLMLMRTIDDVDVGFLFAGHALLAGFKPRTDALALEAVAVSPYKGVVAIRKRVSGTAKVEAFKRAYQSEALKRYFRNRYGDTIIFLDDVNAANETRVTTSHD